MKGWVKTVGAVALASGLIFGSMGLNGALKGPEKALAEEAQKNVIQVTGKGELSIKPDIVYLSIGVDTSAATAAEAQKANAAKIQKITAVLKGTWGVADKDIQTARFSVQPNYTYSEKEGQQVKGYNANHTLQINYRDLDKVGGLLDAVAAAGANNIGNASFSVEDPSAFEAQVLEKAMANADVKAGAIAKAAKRSLGQVVSVTQLDTGSVPVNYMGYEKLAATAAADTAGTSVQPGEIDVTAQVSVTYDMK
ncbi:SIMPL domain-containing protein [Gorillibacterium timonense]|uniref:SIMPL domain-containing protein n=1 Tax=Gorillibacterium timonense TaxID=1689269 RepID=UPI00071CFA6F|nr:SIMPL domain-containing protein [Gorillibacterium timonense]